MLKIIQRIVGTEFLEKEMIMRAYKYNSVTEKQIPRSKRERDGFAENKCSRFGD